MDAIQVIQWLVAGLVVLKSASEFFLDRLNAVYVRERAGKMPPVFQGMIDEEIYARSVDYTLAKNRLDQFSNPCGLIILLSALFSGFLPWSYDVFLDFSGESAWAKAAWIIGIIFLFSAKEWPWEWYRQFRLEERFGFNKTTLRLWILDRIKGAEWAQTGIVPPNPSCFPTILSRRVRPLLWRVWRLLPLEPVWRSLDRF